MDKFDFNFLGDLPEDEAAVEASEISRSGIIPATYRPPGSGVEFGEVGLDNFSDPSTGIVTETNFKPLTPTEASFDPRLAFEVALHPTLVEDIYPRYGLDADQWFAIARSPVFKKAVLDHQAELEEHGVSFRMKARVQAESYLKDVHFLIKHPMTPPTVKADMIKWTAKVADLEPRTNGNEQGTTFNLQINL